MSSIGLNVNTGVNTDTTLKQGSVATVVKEQPVKAKSLEKGDNVELQTYTVKKGDNLWNISKANLGTPIKWPSIYDLNKDQIKNPDLIYPNQVLKLPIAVQHPTPEPEQPVQEPPANNPPAVTPTPPGVPVAPADPLPPPPKEVTLSRKMLIAAGVGGAIGTVAAAGTLIGMTKTLAYPASNLGGYATAQVVAKNLGKIGLNVGSGPQLAKTISSMGGPKSAGALTAVGVGVAAAGLAVGGYYVYDKLCRNF